MNDIAVSREFMRFLTPCCAGFAMRGNKMDQIELFISLARSREISLAWNRSANTNKGHVTLRPITARLNDFVWKFQPACADNPLIVQKLDFYF